MIVYLIVVNDIIYICVYVFFFCVCDYGGGVLDVEFWGSVCVWYVICVEW